MDGCTVPYCTIRTYMMTMIDVDDDVDVIYGTGAGRIAEGSKRRRARQLID